MKEPTCSWRPRKRAGNKFQTTFHPCGPLSTLGSTLKRPTRPTVLSGETQTAQNDAAVNVLPNTPKNLSVVVRRFSQGSAFCLLFPNPHFSFEHIRIPRPTQIHKLVGSLFLAFALVDLHRISLTHIYSLQFSQRH